MDGVLLLRDDQHVADIWYSVETIATLLNVPTMTLNKALSKSPEFTHIDVQGSANRCGIVRFKRQQLYLPVNGVEKKVTRHFLFFPHRKKPIFYKDSNTWSEICTKSAHLKLAARSKTARTVMDLQHSFSLHHHPERRHGNLGTMQCPPKGLISSMTQRPRHCSISPTEPPSMIAFTV
jgi:hypothetical protein